MGAGGDARKLREDYNIDVAGAVDLLPLVHQKDLSSVVNDSVTYSKSEESLAGQAAVTQTV